MKSNHLGRVTLVLAAVCLPVHAMAAEQCLTPFEAQGMMTSVMPDILDGLMKQCAPSLQSTGFFAKSGGAMVSRYRVAGDKSWPVARKAFFKMIGSDKSTATLSALPDEMIKSLVSIGISSKIADDIKPQDCSKVERAVEALSPLPPENIASLIGVVVEMDADKPAKGKSALNICPSASPLPSKSTASK
jgi:hypothetical protein